MVTRDNRMISDDLLSQLFHSWRARAASPWAGRSSHLARTSSAGVITSSALALYSMSWTGLRKAITLSPAAKRAVPPVGSTWLEPAR